MGLAMKNVSNCKSNECMGHWNMDPKQYSLVIYNRTPVVAKGARYFTSRPGLEAVFSAISSETPGESGQGRKSVGGVIIPALVFARRKIVQIKKHR